jgi:hypothetical protein
MLLPTPALFNINALDFDYDANAKPPRRWKTQPKTCAPGSNRAMFC